MLIRSESVGFGSGCSLRCMTRCGAAAGVEDVDLGGRYEACPALSDHFAISRGSTPIGHRTAAPASGAGGWSP